MKGIILKRGYAKLTCQLLSEKDDYQQRTQGQALGFLLLNAGLLPCILHVCKLNVTIALSIKLESGRGIKVLHGNN